MNDKELVAEHAGRRVKDGMIVGLGTGSTADCFIAELARRKNLENLQITTVASSVVSAIKAEAAGLPLMAIEQLSTLDLYVDGADEVVASDNTLLKGQGADLVREKLLAQACDQFIVLIEQSKLVEHIGARFPVPVEVVPFAWQLVKKHLEQLGGRGGLRQNYNGNGFVVTSHGSLVLDMVFDSKMDNERLDALLNSTPGVVEHGVFYGLTDVVLVSVDGAVQEISS